MGQNDWLVQMRVPEQISVHVKCEGESDLSDVIVELIVTSGQKNPYRLYFPKTDRAGVARLTREDFVGQFIEQWEDGLMDHSGTPESADSTVRVGLYDPSWSLENRQLALAWPLLTHERTRWSSREEEYRYRTSSRNLQFVVAQIMVDLEQTSDIVLALQRKAVATSAS